MGSGFAVLVAAGRSVGTITGGTAGSNIGAEVGSGFDVLVGCGGLEVFVGAGGWVGGTGVFISTAIPPVGLLCGRVVAVGVLGLV